MYGSNGDKYKVFAVKVRSKMIQRTIHDVIELCCTVYACVCDDLRGRLLMLDATVLLPT